MDWKTRGRAHVLGDNVPHDGGVMAFEMVIGRITDPQQLTPKLFAEIDPLLASRLRRGDYVVAGRNFLAGKAHNNGLIAMKSMDLRILCESMPVRAYQNVVGLALPCLADCAGIRAMVSDGDELEVDYLSGEVRNLTAGTHATFPSISPGVQDMVERGGMRGLLEHHLAMHPEMRIALDANDKRTRP